MGDSLAIFDAGQRLAWPLLAWATTYLIHSTILLGLAWFALVRLRLDSQAQDVIGKAAIVGGLITATLPMVAGFTPLAGNWSLAPADRLALAEADVTPAGPATPAHSQPVAPIRIAQPPNTLDERSIATQAALAGEDVVASEVLIASHDPAPITDRRDRAASLATPVAAGTSFAGWRFLPLAIVLAWMALAAAGCTSLYIVWRRLQSERAAADWQPAEGLVAEVFARLAAETGLRGKVSLWLSRTPVGPMAFGVWRPRIVLPQALVERLAPAEVEALVAHELAHVVRRDPAWLIGFRWIEAACWFQPLNAVVRSVWQAAAELEADRWAGSRIAEPASLARCLVQAAEWMLSAPRPALVWGMASTGSLLARRVEQLLRYSSDKPRRGRARSAAMVCGAVLAAAVIALPGVAWPTGISVVAADEAGPPVREPARRTEEAVRPRAVPERDVPSRERTRDAALPREPRPSGPAMRSQQIAIATEAAQLEAEIDALETEYESLEEAAATGVSPAAAAQMQRIGEALRRIRARHRQWQTRWDRQMAPSSDGPAEDSRRDEENTR